MGYLDENGAYCEQVKTERTKITQQQLDWWNDLTEPERQVIKFCRSTNEYIRLGLGIASARERTLDQFYTKATGNSPPKKPEKYAYIWDNIKQFKEYLNGLNQSNN